MSEWQPIETAPKDGTVVYLYRQVGDWKVRGHGYWEGGGIVSGWITQGFYDPPGNLGLAHPTHWMPLPAPPVLNGESL